MEARRQERKKTRQGVSLADNLVTPGLHTRYQQAALRILAFWRESQSRPQTWDDMDLATAQWLEHAFAEGHPKGYASDGLAALQHFLPEVSGKLRHSWRLLRSWQKVEPPIRVLPLSPVMVLAISGACARLGYVDAAAAFLISFDTFLRPGELYKLKKKHVTWARGSAVLSLGKTKSGLRKNAAEMVVCESAIANLWLARALATKHDHDLLWDAKPEKLRKLFFGVLEHLGIPGHFSMYSFRRGGATWHFLSSQSLEHTLLRGRWASSSTARIYLQDAAATVAHLQLTQDQRSYMSLLKQFLAAP